MQYWFPSLAMNIEACLLGLLIYVTINLPSIAQVSMSLFIVSLVVQSVFSYNQ